MEVATEFIDLIKAVVPYYKRQLFEGCSDEQIADLESIIKHELPNSYKTILKFCNGEVDDLTAYTSLLGYPMLPAESVAWTFRSIQENADYVGKREVTQKNLVNPYLFIGDRIPFAHDSSGNYLCFDYSPRPEGKIAQIIYLPLGEPDPITCVSDSFDDFLRFLMERINSGKTGLEEGHGLEGNICLDWKIAWWTGWSKTEAKLLE